MTDLPETHYAATHDGVHLAYQIVGGGAPDLLYMPHWATHVEMLWQDPLLSSFVRRLASFSRVIQFDKRGVGLSDPVPIRQLPTLEEWMDDIATVLDAAASERATIVASDIGAVLPILFTASHPERVSGLILVNATARIRRAEDYAIGVPDRVAEQYLAETIRTWGQGSKAYERMDPTTVGDESFHAGVNRYQRATASPGAIAPMFRLLYEADVPGVLPTIRVPTLVVHRVDDPFVRVSHGRYLAEHIPAARLVELPGADHSPDIGDAGLVIREVRSFLTGETVIPNPDRVLATVLFTDIVGSSDVAVRLGDEEWRHLLDRHHEVIRRQLVRFRGREIKTTGDGFLAVFDGPARAIQCACAARDAVRSLGLVLRAGVHAGEIELGSDDVSGIAVHVAARVMALTPPDEVFVSGAVPPLVIGSGIKFDDHGDHQLKGVPGTWRLFGVSR